MRLPVPFPDQHGTWREIDSLPVQAFQPICHRWIQFFGISAIQNLSGFVVEIPKTIGLNSEG
jgi:hypothetical protein